MKSSRKSRTGLLTVILIPVSLLALGVGVVALSASPNPSFSYAPTSLAHARLLLEEGKVKEARAIFTEAFRNNPKNVEALRGLSQCAIEDGDDETALGLLHKLTSLAPKDRGAWRKLALCASRLGKDMEALSAAQTAIGLAPEGDLGMSDLVSRLVTKKSMLEGDIAGDQGPGDALPGKGRKGIGVDPAGGVRLPEIPDPRRNLPSAGRDR